MNQTLYDPCDAPKKTLAKRREKSVTAKTVKVGVGRITACLSVTADGTKLPALIVFKGKRDGQIECKF